MATSQNPGTTSLSPENDRLSLEVDVARAESVLCRIFQQNDLAKLTDTLLPENCFLVGGVVRDALSGKAVQDLDIAVPYPVEETIRLLTGSGIRVVETGIEHGTVLAVFENTKVEITSFRTPSSRNEHKLGSSIEQDLGGRDFTINAIAFSLGSRRFIDPYSGILDLKNTVLRAVNNPRDRLSEDPHRILRAIRFGPGSKRTLDADLEEAMRELGAFLRHVSAERIKQELDKILLSFDPVAAVRKLKDLNLLLYTFPELIPAVDFEQNEFHIHDVFEHTLWVLGRSEPDLILRWSALYHDSGKPPTLTVDEDGRRHFYKHELRSEDLVRERFASLKAGNVETEAVAKLVKYHMRPLDCGPSAVRRLLRDLGPIFDTWLKLKRADASPLVPEEEFEKEFAQFKTLVDDEVAKSALPQYGKLAVNGDDLKALGMSPGPQMGRVLKELAEIVIEEPAKNEKEILLAIVKNMKGI